MSRFFGIVVSMYHDEHLPPHFHARYAGKDVQIGIADARVRGVFHPRALGLVLEWWSLHQAELAENWQLVTEGKQPKPIAPLE